MRLWARLFEVQAFLQFIVAHTASTNSLPSPGTALDWYQPNHDVLYIGAME
jgi:hypothetical protein